MRLENPFHEGERLVQQRVGEESQAQQNGQIIADSIPKGALKFIEQQPMIIVGSVDTQQNVWASTLFGDPGFTKAVDQQTIEIDLSQVSLQAHDPFWANICHQNQIGVLVIELASRRRLRVNGTISQTASSQLRLHVLKAYPNCPKYIQRRQFLPRNQASPKTLFEPESGRFLTSEHQRWIASADTFFVASAHSARGVDASHRGGNPGFIQILNNQTLRIPDYSGNSMFNTLGNLVVNPHAGLIFLDFDQSRTLQLTGQATIQWNLNDSVPTNGSAHPCWDFTVQHWLETSLPKLLQWEFVDYSPHNPVSPELCQV